MRTDPTYQWQLTRQKVLERDGGLCQLCGRPANSVHHIVPVVHGGGRELSNLITLCWSCHNKADKARYKKTDKRAKIFKLGWLKNPGGVSLLFVSPSPTPCTHAFKCIGCQNRIPLYQRLYKPFCAPRKAVMA